MSAVRIIIRGRVQGVGFRAWAVQTANAMGLRGWVRNRTDSSVEALLSGDETKIHEMIEACKKGPPAARVDSIDSYAAGEPEENGFRAKASV